MRSEEVRQLFLDFFARHGHQVVPSSPLVLPADPTLLFANAGMNQFKEVFRGREHRPYTRACSSQKCLRVSGKHNDLEEVGRTPRHHTFFEMLGNFSFGDYFKREAIVWGWELITEGYKIPGERLCVTVFAGDAEFPGDEEAADIWRREVGLPPEKVAALGRKDNFWQMGDTGPAGPCSEIHFDTRPDLPPSTPARDPERFLELWNLVFMQYDLQPDGTARPLPAPCVDTGAGLERLTAVLGGFSSNYDTDLFQSLISALAAEAGLKYGASETADISLRVISDHLRAITMLTTEGVIPGPEKRGAVLRRILRRALRHGRLIGLPVPFLHRHLEGVVDLLGDTFPDLWPGLPVAQKVVRREEERFERTLAAGFEKLDEAIAVRLEARDPVFPGEEAFQLESERGLPFDLIKDAIEERGLRLDEAAYSSARARHAETSRVIKGGAEDLAGLDVFIPHRGEGSRFVGRETLRVDAARVVDIISEGRCVARLEMGGRGEVILDQTPFYAEAGGQAGDRGWLTGGHGRARVEVTHTPLPGVITHRVTVEHGALEKGEILVAEVDEIPRRAAMRNHTATHLLHAALRRNLGTHVKQAGSLVAPDRLRFDFSHFESIDREALRDIETEVNQAIQADYPLETVEMPLEEAMATGAMAFFGDRYGERVRLVRIADVSLELCGGTHVSRTGEIGSFLVAGERGIAAGVRRIEALTGQGAVEKAQQDRDTLEELTARIGVGRGTVLDEIERRLDSLRRLQKENEDLKLKLVRGGSGSSSQTKDVGGLSVISRRADGISRSQLRDLGDSLRQQNPAGVIVLAGASDSSVSILVTTGHQVGTRLDARELVRKLTPLVGGSGGGGRTDLAEGGGKDPSGIEAMLNRVPDLVGEMAGGGAP